MNAKEYFEHIKGRVDEWYGIAREARKKGFDPVSDVETPLASSLAEKAVGLISTLYPQVGDERIVKRILELEKEHGSLNPAVALIIAEEIAKEKFCKFESHKEAMEAGIRIGISYLTLGVVSSPIEGFVNLEIGKTKEGKDYLIPNFSGPIRSAGGTEAGFSVVIVDYLREVFGYDKYDPSEEEVKRGVHESYMYHERVTNLQYLPSETEIDFLMRHVPVQVSGDPSEQVEVYNYKDLQRIRTNFIRSGFCLVFNEGIASKAPKILKRIKKLREKGFKLSDWEWMDEFVELQKKIKENKAVGSAASATYIKDLVAGRPIFGHPSRSGSFRLRYGRCRNTGYSALAIHPASMAVSRDFISIGTQLKIEKPTKGCTVACCDSIDAPFVKFKDGSARYMLNPEETRKKYDDIEEILYFGDLLVPYGDYYNRNHNLDKPGYVEQYWLEELRENGGESELLPDFDKAVELSKKYKVSLHPVYSFYWSQIDYGDFIALLEWLVHGETREGKIVLLYGKNEKERFARGKRALEIIGCEHLVGVENVILNVKESRTLLFNLGLEIGKTEERIDEAMVKIKSIGEKKVLEIINELCELNIRDKGGTFIGSRMGRPEKAKPRKLTGSPNVLFPVGEEGGRLRSFQAAMDTGSVIADFADFYCTKCSRESVYARCEVCGEFCKREEESYSEKRIDIREYFERAKKVLNIRADEVPLVKGIRGTSNKDHSCEYLAKGLLRAKHGLCVNKDGTIRYDMTQMPITHFKPKEIGTSIEKLREMGYEKDINGKELSDSEQVLEIFPQDLIMPACPDSLDEKSDDVLLKICNFVDDELEKIYGMKRIFGFSRRSDLVGSLVACIAPHICTAVVGRVIGFSKTQALLASPYIHAAMRRDCVHPETKFLFFDKGEMHYPEIGKFVEGLIKKGCGTRVIDGVGTLRVEADKEYFTYGVHPESKKMVKRKIKYFIKGPSNKEWIKITTSTNREIRMTLNHDFMYLDGNEIKFKKARDVKEMDKLLVLDHLNFPKVNSSKVDLIEGFIEKLPREAKHKVRIVGCKDFFKKVIKENGVLDRLKIKSVNEWCEAVPLDHLEILLEMGYAIPDDAKVKYWFSNYTLPRYLDINKELCRLLGYYTSEGHCRENRTTRQIGFRICNEKLRKEVLRIIDEYFGIKGIVEEESKITIAYSLVYYFFRYILDAGMGAKTKKIPKIIYSLDKESVLEYVSGFIDGDGSVIPERNAIVLYSTSRQLLDEFALLLTEFHLVGRYQTIKERLPGKRLIDIYHELGLKARSFGLNHLVFVGGDCVRLASLLNLFHENKMKKIKIILDLKRENRLLKLGSKYVQIYSYGECFVDYVKKVEIVKDEKNSYCVEVEWDKKEERSVIWGEQVINTRCDGDEAAIILLGDLLLNFSRKFLPAHRGGTQDAPLVLSARIRAGEVDDMIFDLDVGKKIPLSLYRAAEEEKSPYEVKMEQIRSRLGGNREFNNIDYSYETGDINAGSVCSSYKLLPTMAEKVDKQMELCRKIRAVDVMDVARLIIERHFIRDTRGNLRKFSMQVFRCVQCNSKYRRPPLVGKCTKCGGRLIFTISEGSILKYMQKALDLAKEYNVHPYLLESLELTEMYIQSIFGKDSDRQEKISKWF